MNIKRSPIVFEYRLFDSNINVVNGIRDLGIILSSDLRFKLHIETICAKAFRNLGFIKRNYIDLSYTCLKVLCFYLVRCVLEFGSVIRNPKQIGLIDKLDKIQKSFIRMIAFKLNVCGLPITEVENQCLLSPLGKKNVITLTAYSYRNY